MKIQGDFDSVNLSTGEKSRKIIGDGETKIETVRPQPAPPPADETLPAGAPAECKECKELKDTLEMYMNAWMREIGGFIRRKSHQIDGFVLRTQDALREQYEKGKLDARDGWTGRDKWIEEVGQALGTAAQPSGAHREGLREAAQDVIEWPDEDPDPNTI